MGKNPFEPLDKPEKINGRIKIKMGEFGWKLFVTADDFHLLKKDEKKFKLSF